MPTPEPHPTSTRVRRAGPILALALVLTAALADPPPAAAQGGAAATAAAAGRRMTFWETVQAGGLIGHTIIVLSVVSLSAVIYHAMTLRKERLIPPATAARLEALVKEHRIDEAIEVCREQRPESLLTDVGLAGLQRYKNSEFGFAEYRTAVEEEGEEQTARLYRQTEVLSVIGAIAPMLGLLGTVQGMIEAFDTIAATGGMAKPSDLADSISKAL